MTQQQMEMTSNSTTSSNGTGSARKFADEPAVRSAIPLLVGLMGPSGTGKTYSALRLATGMQRVTGGEIFVIDTESNRARHYAPLPGQKPNPSMGTFNFRHVNFGAPFDPLDYLSAIEHCVKQGAKIVIVDSMSHEHEGVGGVLEQHETEMHRLAKEWNTTTEKVQMTAWSKPKSRRQRLINTILQMQVNCLFCFRAKKKLKIQKGKDPEELGFVPIAGDNFVYEMMVKFVLLPGSRGAPKWRSEYEGEQMNMKIPQQFLHLFDPDAPAQLSEAQGEAMAAWAAGSVEAPDADELKNTLSAIKAAKSAADLKRIMTGTAGRPWTDEQKAAIRDVFEAKKADLAGPGKDA